MNLKSTLLFSFRIQRRMSTFSKSVMTSRSETTVEAKEIVTFSQSADIWWSLEGSIKGLHTFNKHRVPFILGCSTISEAETKNDLKILDIGCGGGVLSEALAKCGSSVTGVDAAPDLIAVAKQHSEINQDLIMKPTYYCTTIEEHAEQFKNHYDRVVASEVIEHVTNKELFIKSCVETLKPGGRLIITCPAKSRISQFVNIIVAENVFNCPAKGTHEYDKFITLKDLQLLLETNGCEIEETKGFAFNMITNAWVEIPTTCLFFAIRAVKVK